MKNEDTIKEVPISPENGLKAEKEKTVVTSELKGIAKVRLEVIQSLLEPCDRATYGERLRSGAKKPDISVRSLQRPFKKYQEQGLNALVSTSIADKGNHRIQSLEVEQWMFCKVIRWKC